FNIRHRSQRRRHLGVRAESRERGVVEHEVMWCGLASDVRAALPSSSYQVDALGYGNVGDVHRRTSADGNREIAAHSARFSRRGNTGDAKALGDFARMARAVPSER